MNHKTSSLLTLVLAFGTSMAQASAPRCPSLTDSLSTIGRQYAEALQQLQAQVPAAAEEQMENPYLYPLLTGGHFYDFPLKQTIGTLNNGDAPQELATLTETVNGVLLDLYTQQPQLVSQDLTNAVVTVAPTPQPTTVQLPVTESPRVSTFSLPTLQDVATPDIEVKKPNFWTYVGNFSFQFMQYMVTDNWYKGGENHNSFLAAANLEANYDNKEKLTFTNKLEMRLGFQTSNNDKEHKYKTNADLLRLTNKLGLQATKHWYYTLMLQTWTQFYQGYKSNDARVYSDFMSPFESILSLGMDYKYAKDNFKINATLSPLAIAFKYVDRSALLAHYGLNDGKHHYFKFGSTATITTQWNLLKNVQWQSRLYFFTNYKSTVAEWENTLNFKVNKFLSSKLFLFPRFDDGVKRMKGHSYFQFNEYLSVGLDLSI